MIFDETALKGAFMIEPEALEDERGLLTRTICAKDFEANGLTFIVAQCNTYLIGRKERYEGCISNWCPRLRIS